MVDFNIKRFSVIFVFIIMLFVKFELKFFKSKYSSMPRFIYIVLLFLFVVSCAPQLAVKEVHMKNMQVDANSGAINPGVYAFVKPYSDSISADMSKLVAVSATPLIKEKPESKLTNLVSDLVLEAGIAYCKTERLNFIPDAAYINYGGIRASLPQGEITVGRIFELMPFENEVVLIRIKGEAMQQMANRIAQRGGEGVAGMKIGIKNEQFSTFTVNGKNVQAESMYWLVTNDYIANGGDQMNMFANPVERINTRLKIRDVLIKRLGDLYSTEGVIDVKEDGRIYHEQ